MTLDGNNNETLGYNTVMKTGESVNANVHKAVLPPFLVFMGWDKTPSWATVSTGAADTNTVDKLVDSGATFQTDGVAAGMVVYNSTDGTFGIVDSVDNETTISLRADTRAGSTLTDVFPLGTENYTVYLNYELPDSWAELNGQTISDSDSPWNGKTLRDLNGGTYRMLRGATSSGGTGGADTHTLTTAEMPAHTHNSGVAYPHGTSGSHACSGLHSSGFNNTGSAGSGNAHNNLPAYCGVVWIQRIK